MESFFRNTMADINWTKIDTIDLGLEVYGFKGFNLYEKILAINS